MDEVARSAFHHCAFLLPRRNNKPRRECLRALGSPHVVAGYHRTRVPFCKPRIVSPLASMPSALATNCCDSCMESRAANWSQRATNKKKCASVSDEGSGQQSRRTFEDIAVPGIRGLLCLLILCNMVAFSLERDRASDGDFTQGLSERRQKSGRRVSVV